jgi:hypothetical protein
MKACLREASDKDDFYRCTFHASRLRVRPHTHTRHRTHVLNIPCIPPPPHV